MTNAKEEFLSTLSGISDVLCAWVMFCEEKNIRYEIERKNTTIHELKCGYSSEEFDVFLESLDFDYEKHISYTKPYKKLNGCIWFTDGTWKIRDIHDSGIEYWSFQMVPRIPASLKFQIEMEIKK